jgi:RNA polymerase-binding transcription factor DksA
MVKKKKTVTKTNTAKSGKARGKPVAKPAAKPAASKKRAAKPAKKTTKATVQPKAKASAKPDTKKTNKKTVAKKTSKPGPALKAHQPAKKTSSAQPPAAKSAASAAAAKPKHAPAPAAPKAKPAPVDEDADAVRLTPAQLRKQIVAKARSGAKVQRAVAFTLDDVRGELARSAPAKPETRRAAPATAKADTPAKPEAAITPTPKEPALPKIEQRSYGAASLADILGYNPVSSERPVDDESKIDKKFLRYYKLLVELRDHVNSGLQTHAEETLKRSSREDSGDLSGYGQHMADAGTDNFDRDFALSLVSNEQEALYEIDQAIKRIKDGTYGICENTGKPISKERLIAVPFARLSIESQIEMEKTQRRSSQRGGVFGDVAGEEGAKFLEDDSE